MTRKIDEPTEQVDPMAADKRTERVDDRMAEEFNELTAKLQRLQAFFGTQAYRELHSEEQSRLALQEQHMRGYANVLSERIAVSKAAV